MYKYTENENVIEGLIVRKLKKDSNKMKAIWSINAIHSYGSILTIQTKYNVTRFLS